MFRGRVEPKWDVTFQGLLRRQGGEVSPRSTVERAVLRDSLNEVSETEGEISSEADICGPFLGEGQEVFGDTITCFALAYWELFQGDRPHKELNSSPGESITKPIAESLKAVVVRLHEYSCTSDKLQAELQLSQALESLVKSIIVAASKYFLDVVDWEKGEYEDNFRICCSSWMERVPEGLEGCLMARMFRILCMAALKRVSKSIKLTNDALKSGSQTACPSRGFNIFSCSALVYACKFFAQLMESKGLMNYSSPQKGISNLEEANFEEFMLSIREESKKALRQEGKFVMEAQRLWQSSPFVDQTGATTEAFQRWSNLLESTRNVTDDPNYDRLMSQFCEGCFISPYSVWRPRHGASAQLLQQSIDLMERALWENFGGVNRWFAKENLSTSGSSAQASDKITPPCGSVDQYAYDLVVALMKLKHSPDWHGTFVRDVAATAQRLTEKLLQTTTIRFSAATHDNLQGQGFSVWMRQLRQACGQDSSDISKLCNLCGCVYEASTKILSDLPSDNAMAPIMIGAPGNHNLVVQILRATPFACLHYQPVASPGPHTEEDFDDFHLKLLERIPGKEIDAEKGQLVKWIITNFKEARLIIKNAKDLRQDIELIDEKIYEDHLPFESKLQKRKDGARFLGLLKGTFKGLKALAKGYCVGSTWLYLVLRPENMIFRDLFVQLSSIIQDLREHVYQRQWNKFDEDQLYQFVKDVEDMKEAQRAGKDLVETLQIEVDLTQNLSQYPINEHLFAKIEEAAKGLGDFAFFLQKERANGSLWPQPLQVQAAQAFVLARLDEHTTDSEHLAKKAAAQDALPVASGQVSMAERLIPSDKCNEALTSVDGLARSLGELGKHAEAAEASMQKQQKQ